MGIQNVDEDYLDTYGIELIAGSPFTGTRQEFRDRLIINEIAAAQFGWTPEEAVGRKITRANGDEVFYVSGVMIDFNAQSAREQIRPMSVWWVVWLYNILTGRVEMDNLPETLAFLEKTWNELLPDRPFTYRFVDENIAEMYDVERNQQRTFTALSGLSIFVACLGLFGLASFTAEQRFREIGVRKVLGASARSVVFLMSRGFLALVLIATGLAIPVAWYVGNDWLSGFAYRIALTPGLFIFSGLLALTIGFLAVVSQSIRASLTDPVDVLRQE
jgi:putative ABC transport system permease protein